MDSVSGFRACLHCPCGAYRWQDTAIQKHETHCLVCGTPFASAKVCYWPRPRKAGGGKGRTQSRTGQPFSGQWPTADWPWLGFGAKGPKGKGGKGNQMGPAGKGQQLLQPGLLTASSTSSGHGRSAAGVAQPASHGINYSRAAKDALYRARTHYDMVRGLWGDGHAYTTAARQGLEAAEKEALEKQPPAKKLAALRQEYGRALDALQQGLHRSDQIEETIGQLQQEYYDVESEVEQTARRIEELQTEINAHEADLPQAAPPGEQKGLRDQLQSLLSSHVRRGGKALTDKQQQRACNNIEELLRDFESEVDEKMDRSDLDSLPALSDEEAVERAPKQRRSTEKVQTQEESAAENQEWQKGLGAVGKKLVRRGLLAKHTVQQLEARQSGGQGGKAKGKGKNGKGKGKIVSFSAAVQAPPPTTTAPTYAQAAAQDRASSSTAAGLPGASVPPGGVPDGGNLTGGWPQLHPKGAAADQGVRAPSTVDAAGYTAQQAQLRRGEGQT